MVFNLLFIRFSLLISLRNIFSVMKNLPVVQEMRFPSLGREDPLQKEMATYSSILALEIPQTKEPGKLQPMGLQRVGHDLAATTTSCPSRRFISNHSPPPFMLNTTNILCICLYTAWISVLNTKSIKHFCPLITSFYSFRGRVILFPQRKIC